MRFAPSTKRTLSLILFLLLYLVAGAILFLLMEQTLENRIRQDLLLSRTRFLLNNSCIKDADLEKFIVQIIEANNRGVSAVANVTSEPNWSFGQSLFFAGTILTTIGYGHVTPLSGGGKLFCVVYSLIGIPLTLIMFTAVVERLMVLTNKLLQLLNGRLGHLYKTFHIKLLHLFILLLLLCTFVFVIPSIVFMVLEDNWDFLDAYYYCFISMTTIGLGDYIPGDGSNQPHRALYKIFTTIYLFLGLICMMLVLANIYEIPELNIGFHFYLKSDAEEEERQRLKPGEVGAKYSSAGLKESGDDSGAYHPNREPERLKDDPNSVVETAQ